MHKEWPATKHCTKCLKEKLLEEFTPSLNGRYRRHSRCKSCTNKYRKQCRKRIGVAREKYLSRLVYQSAVARGVLKRPETCSGCGKKTGTQGHHSDYSRPLEVEWLCHWCHRKKHPHNK